MFIYPKFYSNKISLVPIGCYIKGLLHLVKCYVDHLFDFWKIEFYNDRKTIITVKAFSRSPQSEGEGAHQLSHFYILIFLTVIMVSLMYINPAYSFLSWLKALPFNTSLGTVTFPSCPLWGGAQYKVVCRGGLWHRNLNSSMAKVVWCLILIVRA